MRLDKNSWDLDKIFSDPDAEDYSRRLVWRTLGYRLKSFVKKILYVEFPTFHREETSWTKYQLFLNKDAIVEKIQSGWLTAARFPGGFPRAVGCRGLSLVKVSCSTVGLWLWRTGDSQGIDYLIEQNSRLGLALTLKRDPVKIKTSSLPYSPRLTSIKKY